MAGGRGEGEGRRRRRRRREEKEEGEKAKRKRDMLDKRETPLSFYGYNMTENKSYTSDTWNPRPVAIVTWLTAHFKIHRLHTCWCETSARFEFLLKKQL